MSISNLSSPGTAVTRQFLTSRSKALLILACPGKAQIDQRDHGGVSESKKEETSHEHGQCPQGMHSPFLVFCCITDYPPSKHASDLQSCQQQITHKGAIMKLKNVNQTNVQYSCHYQCRQQCKFQLCCPAVQLKLLFWKQMT